MTLADLTIYGGVTIDANDSTRYQAAIIRARATLESLLGYTLDIERVDDSEWEGTGLEYEEAPYRLYNFNFADAHFRIDPCKAVNAVYIVYDGTTEPQTLTEPEDYRTFLSQGWYRYLDFNYGICGQFVRYAGLKVVVDADWIGKAEVGFPPEIMSLWASFAVDFADPNRGLKSETLGPHRYERFGGDTQNELQISEGNREILRRFAGPKGIILTMPV